MDPQHPLIQVCIPVFNVSVHALVASLLEQIETHQLSCSILVVDDGSDEIYRNELSHWNNNNKVTVHLLPSNTGRAHARNKCAQLASAPFLLFIDADVTILDPDFLVKYQSCCKDNHITVGGRQWPKTWPPPGYRLRHKYGVQCEQADPALRGENTWAQFASNNFCVPRNLLLENPFQPLPYPYGYEDVWWAFTVTQKGGVLHFTTNPVGVSDMTSDTEFIEKTKDALRNLVDISQKEKNRVWSEGIHLLYLTSRLPGWLKTILASMCHITEVCLIKSLRLGWTCITLFQFWKLTYYCEKVRESFRKHQLNT